MNEIELDLIKSSELRISLKDYKTVDYQKEPKTRKRDYDLEKALTDKPITEFGGF